MKVSVKNQSNKFKPIELTVLIETEDELLSLYHSIDPSFNFIMENASKSKLPAPFNVVYLGEFCAKLRELYNAPI